MKRNKKGWATVRLSPETLEILAIYTQDEGLERLAKGELTGITIGGRNVHIVCTKPKVS